MLTKFKIQFEEGRFFFPSSSINHVNTKEKYIQVFLNGFVFRLGELTIGIKNAVVFLNQEDTVVYCKSLS